MLPFLNDCWSSEPPSETEATVEDFLFFRPNHPLSVSSFIWGGSKPYSAASCPNIHRTLNPIKGSHVHIKEDCVVIGVAIIGVDSFEPLRKLNIAEPVPTPVHHEAHSFSQCLGVIYVMVAVQINIVSIRTPSNGFGKAINPNLELIILTLYSPAVPHEVRAHFVLVGISLEVKISFWVPGFNVMLPTKWNPQVGKTCSLCHGLEITRGGSFSGSAVDTNISIPGRSDFPEGLEGLGVSNFSFKTSRSATRFTGKSLGSWSSTQEKANQISQTTDMPHSQSASSLGRNTQFPGQGPPLLFIEYIRVTPHPLRNRTRTRTRTGIMFSFFRPHSIPISITPLSLKQPLSMIKLISLAPRQRPRFHQRQPPLHLVNPSTRRQRQCLLLVRLLATRANPLTSPQSIPITIPTNLVITLAGEHIQTPLISHDPSITPRHCTRGPFCTSHLGVARFGLNHLVLQVCTCELVKTTREQRTRSVLLLHSPRIRPLQRNLHRLVIRRWRNVNRVGSKTNTSISIISFLIQIIAQLCNLPNRRGSVLEFRGHDDEL
ncbi:hypothetical protein CR513_26405, partial [Mucuna pruriens]